MISYLGLPLEWPDGEIFGTICVLDYKKFDFEPQFRKILANFKNVVDGDLQSLVELVEQEVNEVERIKAERLTGVLEMAGAACHELNQPLQVIMGYVDIILDKERNQDIVHDHLHIISEQIHQLKNITNKIQNISRYKTKKYFHDSVIVDINNSGKSEIN